jgi:AraC family transcriptional regulator
VLMEPLHKIHTGSALATALEQARFATERQSAAADIAVDVSSAGQTQSTVSAILELLNRADQALAKDRNQARDCIEQARTLLNAECSDTVAADRSIAPRAVRSCLAPWQLKRSLEFVEANLAAKVRIGDLAAVARLSRSYFARAFQTSIGETPYSYITRRRVARAQKMILSTAKPLSAIALDCGFSDQAHLTRIFRRIVGTSPGRWCRMQGARAVARVALPERAGILAAAAR